MTDPYTYTSLPDHIRNALSDHANGGGDGLDDAVQAIMEHPEYPRAGEMTGEQCQERIAAGRHYERYVVVTWLRKQAAEARYKDQRLCAIEFANQIEAGEHDALPNAPAENP